MKSTLHSGAFDLPPALLAEVEAAAQEEHRPVEEVLRGLIESGLNQRSREARAEAEYHRAREAGLPDDSQAMSDEYRQSIRAKITQGLQSLREGKGTDGDAFMAAMDAELAALERQGR